MKKYFLLLVIVVAIIVFGYKKTDAVEKSNILVHEVDLTKQNLRLFWKDENGENFRNFATLKTWLKKNNQKLVFATNGGMYMKDRRPLGLFIEDGKTLKKTNKVQEAKGNFYLQPNGIFYLKNDSTAGVCKTLKFNETNVNYATQSGPMLVIDGKIHDKFTKGSKNLNVRNGVGILPNGNVLFAMSKERINFYDFASYFKSLGCDNALYLDGYVSRTYLPSKNWTKGDGNFGVIIAETSTSN